MPASRKDTINNSNVLEMMGVWFYNAALSKKDGLQHMAAAFQLSCRHVRDRAVFFNLLQKAVQSQLCFTKPSLVRHATPERLIFLGGKAAALPLRQASDAVWIAADLPVGLPWPCAREPPDGR